MKARKIEVDTNLSLKLDKEKAIKVLSEYPGVVSAINNDQNLEVRVGGSNMSSRRNNMEDVLIYLYYSGATSWKTEGFMIFKKLETLLFRHSSKKNPR